MASLIMRGFLFNLARGSLFGRGGGGQLAHPRVLSSSNQNQGCDFLLWIRRSTIHHHKSHGARVCLLSGGQRVVVADSKACHLFSLCLIS